MSTPELQISGPPFIHPPFQGPGTQIWEDEWAMFLDNRRRLVEEISARIGLARGLEPAFPEVSPENRLGIADAVWAGQRMREWQNPQEFAAVHGLRNLQYNDLVGRAQYYAGDQADLSGFTPDELSQIIMSGRERMQEARREEGDQLSELISELARGPGAIFTGGTQSLIRTAHTIPLFGDWIAKTKAARQFDQWISKIDEGFRTDLYENEQLAYDITRGGAGLITYAIPGAFAWKAAGRLTGGILNGTRFGNRLSPIGKTAIRGSVGTALLESGGDAPWEERVLIIGAGGALAGGVHAIAPRVLGIYNRLQKSFNSGRWDPRTWGALDADPIPLSQEAPIHTVFPEEAVLPGAQRRLPPFIEPARQGTATPQPPTAPQPPFALQSVSGPRAALTDVPGQLTPVQPRALLPGPDLRVNELPPSTTRGLRRLEVYEPGDPRIADLPLDRTTILATLDSPQGPVNVWAQMDKVTNTFKIETIAATGRSINDPGVDIGTAAIRRHGRELIEALNEKGLFPETIGGIRISGAHKYGEYTEVSVEALMRRGRRAAQEAEALNKQAAVIESPAIANLSTSPRYTDADVGQALIESNPGGISIVRNVGDVAQTVSQLVRQSQGRLMPHQIRVVDRTVTDNRPSGSVAGMPAPAVGTGWTQTDILISDGMPVTNKRVDQYKQFGFFEGQQVLTRYGLEAVVDKIGTEMIKVRILPSDQTYLILPEELAAGRFAVSGLEVPDPTAPALYDNLRSFVTQEMGRELRRAGLSERGWLDTETSTQLPRLVEQFLDEQKITNPVTRSVYTNYFNIRRTQDFEKLAPADELAALNTMRREVAKEMGEAVQSGRLVSSLPEIAEAKGFYLDDAGNGNFRVTDARSGNSVEMSEAEAYTFLRTVQRETPSVMEPMSVPEELLQGIPGASHFGTSTPPVLTNEAQVAGLSRVARTVERELEELERAFRDIERGDIGGGRGGEPPFTGIPRAAEPDPFGGPIEQLRRAQPVPPTPPPPPSGGPPFLPGTAGMPELPPGPGEIPGQFRRHGATAYAAVDNYVTSVGFKWFSKTQTAMRNLDERMQDVLGRRVGLADQYNKVSTAYVKARNDARPWLHEADGILAKFRHEHIRDGTVTRLQEIADMNQKARAMEAMGYSPRERQAQIDLAEYLDRFFRYMVEDPAYKITDTNYVIGYMSRVRARQLAGMEDAWADVDNMLPNHLKFFAEEMRKGGLDAREMHAGNIIGRLVRAAMFHKHVRPHWEAMAQQWDQPGIPEQVRGFVKGFLETVHRGRNVQEDIMLVGFRQYLNRMGVPATDGDMAALSGGLVGNMYRAYLGLRPDVILREFFQPFMAGSKIGLKNITKGYTDFLGGGDKKTAMVRRAIQKGWVEPGVPRGVYAGAFEESVTPATSQTSFYAGGTAREMQQQQLTLANRRENWQEFLDVIRDMLPARARQGIADTGLDPLYFYGKSTSGGKVIAGNVAYDVMEAAIRDLQAGKIKDINALHSKVGTDYYGRPVRQAIDDLIVKGDVDGAATRLADEVVTDAMLRAGPHEQPRGLREGSAFTRLAFMFGTFSIGVVNWLGSGLKTPAPMAAKFAARYGTVMAALAASEAATGFKFTRWLYHDALLWFGGPVASAALTGLQAWRGTTNILSGYQPSAGESEAMRTVGSGRPVSEVFRGLNPYSGGMRTAERVLEGLEGPNPGYYIPRFLVTGERPATAYADDIYRYVNQELGPRLSFPSPHEGTGGFTPEGAVPPFLRRNAPADTGVRPPFLLPGAGAQQ